MTVKSLSPKAVVKNKLNLSIYNLVVLLNGMDQLTKVGLVYNLLHVVTSSKTHLELSKRSAYGQVGYSKKKQDQIYMWVKQHSFFLSLYTATPPREDYVHSWVLCRKDSIISPVMISHGNFCINVLPVT